MKKQICCIIAAVTVVTMLPGCGAKDTPADYSPVPAAVSTVTPESAVPPTSAAAPERTITEDMAYEGVDNYCQKCMTGVWQNNSRTVCMWQVTVKRTASMS